MRKLTVVVSALILVCGAASAHAQANDNPVTELAGIKRLTCTFPVAASVTWSKEGVPSIRLRENSILTVRVQEIDTADGTAVITAPTQADGSAQLYGWNLPIMEPSRSGRMLMLTVFGRESKDKKLKAVYTRTDYLPVDLPGFSSEPEATQYHGDCEAGR